MTGVTDEDINGEGEGSVEMNTWNEADSDGVPDTVAQHNEMGRVENLGVSPDPFELRPIINRTAQADTNVVDLHTDDDLQNLHLEFSPFLCSECMGSGERFFFVVSYFIFCCVV